MLIDSIIIMNYRKIFIYVMTGLTCQEILVDKTLIIS